MKRLVFPALIASIMLVASPFILNSDAFGYQPAAKRVAKQCENLYVRYLEIGQDSFRQQYGNIYDVESCIKMYKDPSWTFNGKSKIDKQFQKIAQTLQGTAKKISGSYDIKKIAILYKAKSGQNRFTVSFNLCAGYEDINTSKIMVKSDLDRFILASNKHITHGTCKEFLTDIDARYSNTVEVDFADLKTLGDPSIRVKTS